MADRRALCVCCGAPANARVRGGRLIAMRGVSARRVIGARGRAHRVPFYVHADRAYCIRRMPRARRRPDFTLPEWGGFDPLASARARG
jgi:hypothetical protein